MAKSNVKQFITPIGALVWPHLVNPDYGTEKFPKKDGEYNTRLTLTPVDRDTLAKNLDPLHAQAAAAGEAMWRALPAAKRNKNPWKVNPWFVPEYAADGETETGNFIVSFKSKASGKTKKGDVWTRQPALFDSMGQPVSRKGLRIFSGTLARVAFSVPCNFDGDTETPGYWTEIAGAGLSLRLEAVQIIKLASSERTASSYGFDAVEGGFSASEVGEEDAEGETEAPTPTVSEHDDF